MGDWLLGKSAKMWVNEICVRQLVRPDWATREAHPGQQPPTFICSCTIKYTDKRLLGMSLEAHLDYLEAIFI